MSHFPDDLRQGIEARNSARPQSIGPGVSGTRARGRMLRCVWSTMTFPTSLRSASPHARAQNPPPACARTHASTCAHGRGAPAAQVRQQMGRKNDRVDVVGQAIWGMYSVKLWGTYIVRDEHIAFSEVNYYYISTISLPTTKLVLRKENSFIPHCPPHTRVGKVWDCDSLTNPLLNLMRDHSTTQHNNVPWFQSDP